MVNGVPQLTQCCCGCTLRTGTKFIAWLAIITGCIDTIYYLLGGSEKGSKSMDQEEESARTFAAIKCVISALRVIFSFLLLQGAYKNNPKLFMPWIVYDLVAIMSESLLIFIAIFIGVSGAFIIGLMIVIGIHVYFILVVYSDYREEIQRDQAQTV